MSAYTTLRITRSKARTVIAQQAFNTMDDSLLEELMDLVLSDRLYNVKIVPDNENNDNPTITP